MAISPTKRRTLSLSPRGTSLLQLANKLKDLDLEVVKAFQNTTLTERLSFVEACFLQEFLEVREKARALEKGNLTDKPSPYYVIYLQFLTKVYEIYAKRAKNLRGGSEAWADLPPHQWITPEETDEEEELEEDEDDSIIRL